MHSAKEKKYGREGGRLWYWDQEDREGPTMKTTFVRNWRQLGSCCVNVQGMRIPGGGNSRCKHPEAVVCQVEQQEGPRDWSKRRRDLGEESIETMIM